MSSMNILISRLSSLGDVVQSLPVACGLKRAYPTARLTWVVQAPYAPLLAAHPQIDEVISLPRRWTIRPLVWWTLRRQLRASRFALAIDAQGLTKSALVGWLSGAPRRIGFGGRWGREISTWFHTETVATDDQTHVVHRNLRLLAPLGITDAEIEYGLRGAEESADDLAVVQRAIQELGAPQDFALIHVGATWASKQWPAERFAEVARHLGQRCGLRSLVLWGTDDESRTAGWVVANAGGHAVHAPRLSLTQLASLTRRARLFLAGDTGPLHLAAAIEIPTIGLYGPWPAEQHGPLGPAAINLQRMTVAGSTRLRRHASTEAIEAINVSDVCGACEQLLEARRAA